MHFGVLVRSGVSMDRVRNNSLDNKFVIFSDSLSVLKSLNHTSSNKKTTTNIQNLIEKHHEISKTQEILFCWLPSNVGIKRNEAADVKAKASLDLDISNFNVRILNLLSTGTSYK